MSTTLRRNRLMFPGTPHRLVNHRAGRRDRRHGCTVLQHALLPPDLLKLRGAAGTAGQRSCAPAAPPLGPAIPRRLARVAPWPLAAGRDRALRSTPTAPAHAASDRACVPLRYRPPVDFLIRRLKFGGRLSPRPAAGRARSPPRWPNAAASPPDCIVPVPLHPLRLRERGFNQALELARAAARRFRIPLLAEGLRRVRHPPADSAGRPPLPDQSAGRVRAGRSAARTAGRADGRCRPRPPAPSPNAPGSLRAGGATDIELRAIGRADARISLSR
ncbi:MAG: hypothetical protein MZV65_41290 [Chromatiales bacterium]|nr:hypothetical protein [Chromatiales bacterium]